MAVSAPVPDRRSRSFEKSPAPEPGSPRPCRGGMESHSWFRAWRRGPASAGRNPRTPGAFPTWMFFPGPGLRFFG